MNETKHTPGPWTASSHSIWGPKHDESKHSNGQVLVAQVIRGIHRADPQLDGGADRFGFDSEADARLIAAAPELLAALRLALTFAEDELEVRERSYCTEDTAPDDPLYMEYVKPAKVLVETIRASIAKAS